MATQEPPDKRHLLIFHVAGHACALPAERVPELVFLPALVHSPAQPAILDGFLNLRGAAVPVLPLHRLFDLPAPPGGLHSPLLIVRSGGSLLALRVDQVEEVAPIRASAIQPYTRDDSWNECAEGQFSRNGQDTVLLSADRLLLAKERECLADLQAQTQRRLENLEAGPT